MYYFRGGVNPVAVVATIVAALVPIGVVIWGTSYQASFTWFIGAAIGFVIYMLGMKLLPTELIYGTRTRAAEPSEASAI